MSKAMFTKIILSKDKRFSLELQTKFNSFYIDYSTGENFNLFTGEILRVSKKTNVETRYNNYNNRTDFFKALNNIAKNKNINIIGSVINNI